MRKTIGAVAVATAVAGVGGAAIAAATETGYHPNSGGFGGFGGPPPAAHRSNSEPLSLHGEYVVAENGAFETRITQTGKITAISPTSVTTRSADGFAQTYVIHEVEGASAPPFAVGDTVVITATRKGETATVSTMGPPLSPGS
ncbi:hypothetical protein B1790_30775 [Mycobacterium sp. AT1]|nr:hypothetical protein B1790_30775 [Mycobacterium sp. AT1]